MSPLHSVRCPNESDEYRTARDALLQEEIELRRHTEAVAEQRRRLPLGGEVPTDYGFDEGGSRTVRVVAKAPIEQFEAHARTRGWRNVRLLSSANTTYNADYQGESDRGQNPIATVFVRREGKIHHFWSSELFFAPTEPGMHPRQVDFIWPLWAVLDLTPEGRGTEWGPELAYG
jgi:predicted dithiol-disulfide oxidoreductase (DUF899 family)